MPDGPLRVFVGTSASGEDAEACAYVYGIVVNDVIRYIGKGRGGRAWYHVKYARVLLRQPVKLSRSSKFYRKLAAVIQDGAGIEIKIFKTDLSDSDAFALERKLINHHRYLWNTLREQRHDSEWRQKHLAALSSPEIRMKMGAVSRAQWADPIIRRRRMAALAKIGRAPAHRAAISAGLLRYYQDPNNRAAKAARDARVREVLNRPSWRAQRSKISQELAKDPVYRAKISAGVVAYCATSDARIKKSRATKRNWRRRSYRVAVIGAMRKTKCTPEFRARMSKKMREVRRAMRENNTHV